MPTCSAFKQYRKRLGLSQGKVAAELGRPISYISGMERGVFVPSIAALSEIIAMLQRYGVEVTYNDLIR